MNQRCLRLLACGLVLAFASSAQTESAPGPAQQVFVDGVAQKVAAFSKEAEWIRHDLFVETPLDSDRDGRRDRVHVDVTRPRQTDTEGLKVHVIYESSPYYSGTSGTDPAHFWNPNHELGAEPPDRPHPASIRHQGRRPVISNSEVRRWVPRGFAVVHSESPGTGLSQGCPTLGGANEALAPKAVIDWLNGRAKGYTEVEGGEEVVASWATGKVGMLGTSYNGTLPIAAATTGVDGLEAIVPMAPNTSYYHYYRANGLIRHPGGYMGEDIDVLFDFIHSGYPTLRESCNRDVRDEILLANLDRITGDYSDFWHGRNYREQLDAIDCAVLSIHGLNDWNVMPNHSVAVYESLRRRGVPSMLYLHQGGHRGMSALPLVLKWMSRYVCGVDNDVDDLPRSWIVREGESPANPTGYADYPNPAAKPVVLVPGAGGRALGTLGLAADSRPLEELVDESSVPGAALAAASESEHRLLYVTPTLREPVHISGRVRVKVRVSSDKPAANLSVWLVSLPWKGSRRQIGDDIITRGWADPQNRGDLRSSKPLTPGEFVEFAFDLEPDDQIVPAGAQIGLMLFASDLDFTLRPKPGTKLTFDLAGTQITVPVVGGVAAYERAVGGE